MEAARASIAEQTGLMLDSHASSYWEGDYYRAKASGGELVLQVSADVIDGEPISTSAVPTSWTIAVVGIPGIALKAPWVRVARMSPWGAS